MISIKGEMRDHTRCLQAESGSGQCYRVGSQHMFSSFHIMRYLCQKMLNGTKLLVDFFLNVKIITMSAVK